MASICVRSTPVSWWSGRANVEAGLVVAGFFVDRGAGKGLGGAGACGGQRLEVGLDRGVTGGQLVLIDVEELEILLQHEEVLRAVVPGEGGGDLGLGGVAPRVAMLGEVPGGRADPATMSRRMRSPVTPVMSLMTTWELQIHLHERLLHPLDVRGRALDQRLAVAQIGAQGRDRGGRSKAAAQQADAVQLPEPLAVRGRRSCGRGRS